jgi:hypothetical protein
VLLPANVVEGLNFLWLGVLVHELKTDRYTRPDVIVRKLGQTSRGQIWTLSEGRHRFVAHLIAGRANIDAKEEEVEDDG